MKDETRWISGNKEDWSLIPVIEIHLFVKLLLEKDLGNSVYVLKYNPLI